MLALQLPPNPDPTDSATRARARQGRRGAYQQLVELQRKLYDAAHSDDCTPSALSQVVRAWCEAEERKRILRMKPKPRDVDVSKAHAPSRARHATNFTEPTAGNLLNAQTVTTPPPVSPD